MGVYLHKHLHQTLLWALRSQLWWPFIRRHGRSLPTAAYDVSILQAMSKPWVLQSRYLRNTC